MIIWILLIALIVTAIAVTLGIVFGYAKNKRYRRYLAIGLSVCVAIGIFCMAVGGFYANKVNAVKRDYDDIMIYHELVTMSDNEEVRFGHYEKICAFNDKYDELERFSKNFWFGTLIDSDWNEFMHSIDFEFRGVYGG